MKCEYCNSEITSNDLNCPYCYLHNEKYYKEYTCNGKTLELISIKGNELNHSSLYISKQFYNKNLFKIKIRLFPISFIIIEIFIFILLIYYFLFGMI